MCFVTKVGFFVFVFWLLFIRVWGWGGGGDFAYVGFFFTLYAYDDSEGNPLFCTSISITMTGKGVEKGGRQMENNYTL